MSTTKLTPDTLVKMLDNERKSVHGGDYQYEVGVWTPEIQDIDLCERGYHVVRLGDVVGWTADTMWLVETRGEGITDSDGKSVYPSIRITEQVKTWNAHTMRHWACDCVERALARVSNPDPGSVEAVRVARLYADGKVSDVELVAAQHAAGATVYAVYAANAVSAGSAAEKATAWAVAWAASSVIARVAAWGVSSEMMNVLAWVAVTVAYNTYDKERVVQIDLLLARLNNAE